MCGIAGIVHFDGRIVDLSKLEGATNALAHRGPDGQGIYIWNNVGLGHRRLSILDLSDAAMQPMHSQDDNYVLIFNGEIYNFRDKRAGLEKKGHMFRSSGDSEVLLHLYIEYGEQCVDHLRGMFAFAILDKKKGTLFLARDRLGKKPLKFFFNDNTFAFASELKALRTLPDCPRGVHEEMLHHYLTMMYVPAPETGFSGIQKLPAAHTLTIDLKSGKQTFKQYWQLQYGSDRKSVDMWKEEILSIYKESVKLRMISDVPVGAFLSGGIDSASVVALMSQMSEHPVKTFSIGSGQDSHNELPDALRIATRYRTDHTPIIVEPDIIRLFPELVRTYEEPFADPSVIPTYLLACETRKHVTVALNGDGGDENFGGYLRYPILRFSEKWARWPRTTHMLARGGTRLFNRVASSTLSYRADRFEASIGLPWPKRYLQYLSFFTEEEKRALYRDSWKQFGRTDDFYAARTSKARGLGDDTLHQAMSMDLGSYLAGDLLPKVDLGSMASGLEARSPLLDHVLLEHTARIPSDLLVRGRNKKYLFKKILRDLVPEETLSGKKRGFRLPLDHWFRSDLQSFMKDRLLAADSPLWQYMDRSAMQRFIDHYLATRTDYSDHIWSLLWLDEWLRQYT